jgi:DNA end-binding protein Ku
MRSIWSGSISFGLVNIPVKLNSAIESENGLNFDMLSKKDMAPIRYARIDTKTGKEVAWKDIVKGYEYTKGKYVIVTDEDFAKASPEKSKTIDIIQFVKEEEIDPIFYEKPYYIMPDKGADKSYHLLLTALEESKTVGLAEFMLRNRVHICAIKPYNGVLLINQMRYKEEIREAPEVEKPKSEKISPKEVQLAIKLIEQLTEKFNPAAFKDTYVSELKKVIKAKAAGKQIRIVDEPKKSTAAVKDLMDVLKESLNQSKKRA